MQLSDKVTTLKYVNNKYGEVLEKIEIFTIKDLLTYFPFRYVDTSEVTPITDLLLEENFDKIYQIQGTIESFRSGYIRGGRTIQSAKLIDETGHIKCMWFNQPFLKNALKDGLNFIFSGKLKKGKSGYTFYPNFYEEVKSSKELVHLARITPDYYLTEGLSKKWLRNRIKSLIDDLHKIDIKDELARENLKQAISNVHFPETYQKLDQAIGYLSTLEFLNIQFKIIEESKKKVSQKSAKIDKDKVWKDYKHFTTKIPFELTQDQQKVIKSLLEKLISAENINSLVQGDVGSGKTMVALSLSYILARQGYQSVILAPTTILAKQHFLTFSKFLEDTGIEVELVTSENKKTQSKSILIGTSAVLARKLDLIKDLGLIIVDEQHRFGVSQREDLLKPLEQALKLQDVYPHFLNMTATPIPRTIAQALFGDIDVQTINSKPLGRKVIQTFIVPPLKRKDSYKWIADKIKEGDQIYWVCPLITESEILDAKSAEETFAALKKEKSLKGFKAALLHGRMKDSEKNQILQDFKDKKYDILVSTSVIEVGIDVANATVMIIENGERFGLAQLHQIRGRVGRGLKQSYCFILYASSIKEAGLNRLKFLSENDNGLNIAEYDLQTRGPGEIYGFRQSGIPKLKIANFANLELIKNSRKIADELYKQGVRNISLFCN